jgi:uncharacterized membrane protein
MFELLFQYPRTVFTRGELVLLLGWPKWLLVLSILVGAGLLGWLIRDRLRQAAETVRSGWRPVVLWALQSTLLAVILTLLWQPAVLISTLKPQQNVVAVLVDDSASMAIADEGAMRLDNAKKTLDSGLLTALEKKFQTRVDRISDTLQRIQKLDAVTAKSGATHIAAGLKQLTVESAGLPVGAVVLLSDGSDNAGGIDLETVSELRTRRIPVHTIGFGKPVPENDVEVLDAQTSTRALADSRLSVRVTFHQYGFAGRKGKLTLREGGKVLAARDVTFGKDGVRTQESLLFNAGAAGAKALEIRFDAQPGERNNKNNATLRLLNVENSKPRILYIEGEPRWEYKFIRRALENDKNVEIVAMLRTTQNKVYRQGGAATDLKDGFPVSVDELFGYQGIVIGSAEAAYFSSKQLELLQVFVDRRGGGVLWLGSRAGLADGAWGKATVAELLPTALPDRRGTFVREQASVELAPAGIDNLITRLVEDPAKNAERWKQLPHLADYQDPGTPKPGAAVLASMNPGGKGSMPFLVIQNFGRGRTAIAAGSTWRWQMQQPVEDQTHEMFWQQLLRWLVTDTPGRVVTSTPRPMLLDDGRVKLTADVRDKNFLAAADAKVEVSIMGPEAGGALLEMTPDPVNPGIFHAEWVAEKQGSYIAEVKASRGEEELGRDTVAFQRQDGLAENFHTEQNVELLTKLAEGTGGRYWKPSDVAKLPEEISYSEAGITVRETRDLWNMPAVFLLLLALRASEWLLRRRWGVV